MSAGLWGRRSPPAGWDGYFFIGIFPAPVSDSAAVSDSASVSGSASGSTAVSVSGSVAASEAPLLWCKVHLFSGGASPEKHCLSALEGLDGRPQELVLLGRPGRVERAGHEIAATSIASDRLDARGGDVRFEMDGDRARVVAPSFAADLAPRDPLFWIRAPRVLTYFSATGELSVRAGDRTHAGFGVLEHAWGAQTRLDVARLAPRRWHWDVLWLGGDRFFAGLALHGLGVHGGARLEPGGKLARVRRLSVRVLESRGDAPARWSGVMATRRGTLRYEARATTEMAREVDGGGFLGFAWEGELDREPVSGAGFCEQRGA